jgi:hypothetical protein
MTDPVLDDPDEPMPLRTKVAAGVAALVAVLLVGFGLLRLSSPAIAAGRKPPAGHYPFDCAICHSVATETATP